MEIFHLLDEMELILKESKKLPLSGGKTMIESHRFFDCLDRLRAILPEELENARLITAEKERILREAYDEADLYLEQSRNKVARLIDNNEITQKSIKMAEEIIAKAERTAQEIRRDADEYADGVLSHMEIILKKGLEAISQGREELRDSIFKESL
jgi:phage shock protein A